MRQCTEQQQQQQPAGKAAGGLGGTRARAFCVLRRAFAADASGVSWGVCASWGGGGCASKRVVRWTGRVGVFEH